MASCRLLAPGILWHVIAEDARPDEICGPVLVLAGLPAVVSLVLLSVPASGWQPLATLMQLPVAALG